MKKSIALFCLLLMISFFCQAEQKEEIKATQKFDVILNVDVMKISKKDIAKNQLIKSGLETSQVFGKADYFMGMSKKEVILLKKINDSDDNFLAYKIKLKETARIKIDDGYLTDVAKKLAEKLMKENETVLIFCDRMSPVKILASYSEETFKISQHNGWFRGDKIFPVKLIFIKSYKVVDSEKTKK
jgi:hypothetical protein